MYQELKWVISNCYDKGNLREEWQIIMAPKWKWYKHNIFCYVLLLKKSILYLMSRNFAKLRDTESGFHEKSMSIAMNAMETYNKDEQLDVAETTKQVWCGK